MMEDEPDEFPCPNPDCEEDIEYEEDGTIPRHCCWCSHELTCPKCRPQKLRKKGKKGLAKFCSRCKYVFVKQEGAKSLPHIANDYGKLEESHGTRSMPHITIVDTDTKTEKDIECHMRLGVCPLGELCLGHKCYRRSIENVPMESKRTMEGLVEDHDSLDIGSILEQPLEFDDEISPEVHVKDQHAGHNVAGAKTLMYPVYSSYQGPLARFRHFRDESHWMSYRWLGCQQDTYTPLTILQSGFDLSVQEIDLSQDHHPITQYQYISPLPSSLPHTEGEQSFIPALSILSTPSMQNTDGVSYQIPDHSTDETANQHYNSQEKPGVNTCSLTDTGYLLPVASILQNNDESVVIEGQEINLSTVDQDHRPIIQDSMEKEFEAQDHVHGEISKPDTSGNLAEDDSENNNPGVEAIKQEKETLLEEVRATKEYLVALLKETKEIEDLRRLIRCNASEFQQRRDVTDFVDSMKLHKDKIANFEFATGPSHQSSFTWEPRSILRRQDSCTTKKSVTFDGTSFLTRHSSAWAPERFLRKAGGYAKEAQCILSFCSSGYCTDGAHEAESRTELEHNEEEVKTGFSEWTTGSYRSYDNNEDGQKRRLLSQVYRSRDTGFGTSIETSPGSDVLKQYDSSLNYLPLLSNSFHFPPSSQDLNRDALHLSKEDAEVPLGTASDSDSLKQNGSSLNYLPTFLNSFNSPPSSQNLNRDALVPKECFDVDTQREPTYYSGQSSVPVPAPREILDDTINVSTPTADPRKGRNSPTVFKEPSRPIPLRRSDLGLAPVLQELHRPVPSPRRYLQAPQVQEGIISRPAPSPRQSISLPSSPQEHNRPVPAPRECYDVTIQPGDKLDILPPNQTVNSPDSKHSCVPIPTPRSLTSALSTGLAGHNYSRTRKRVVDGSRYESVESLWGRSPRKSSYWDFVPQNSASLQYVELRVSLHEVIDITSIVVSCLMTAQSLVDITEYNAPVPEDNLKRILNPNYLLEDVDMDLALDQMRKQWPQVLSQTTLYSPCPKHYECAGDGDYVQVILAPPFKSGHWASFTSIGGEGKIRYFDSMSLPLSDNIMHAISEIAGVSLLEVKSRLKQEKVQKQKGATDCGLFAIAHLVEVLCKGDPTAVTFEQGRIMREHYYDCLVKHNWLPFPRVRQALPNTEPREKSDLASEEALNQSGSTSPDWPVSEAVSQVAKVNGKSVSIDKDVKSPLNQAHGKPAEEMQSSPSASTEVVWKDLVSRDPSDSLDNSQSYGSQPAREKTTLNQARILPVLYLRPGHKAPHTSKEFISKEPIPSEPVHDESAPAANDLPLLLTAQLPRPRNAKRTKQPRIKRRRYRKGMSLVDKLIKSFERLEEEIKREETDNWVTEQQHYLSIGGRHYIAHEEMSVAEQASVVGNGNEISRNMSVLDDQSPPGEVAQSVDLSRSISSTNSIITYPGHRVRSAQDEFTQEECHTALDGITHDSSNYDSGSTLTRVISAQDTFTSAGDRGESEYSSRSNGSGSTLSGLVSAQGDHSSATASGDDVLTVSSGITLSQIISAQDDQSTVISSEDSSRTVSSNSTRSEVISAQEDQSSAESGEDDSESILSGTNSQRTGVTLSQLGSAQDDQTSARLTDNDSGTTYSNSSGVTLSQLASAQDDQSSVVSSEESSERIGDLNSRGSGDTLSQLSSAQDDQSSSRSSYDGSSTMGSNGSGTTQEGAISVQGDQLPLPEDDWSVSGDSDDSGSTLSRAPGSDQDDWLPLEAR